MNFYFSLKVIEEIEQKSKFSKERQIMHQKRIEIKQVKQTATIKYNYKSSQMVQFHPLFRFSRDHSTLQPLQLFRSLIRPVCNFFERMQK